MGPIAVAAYSYMSLVPIIQPPIMKLLTTEKRTSDQDGTVKNSHKDREDYVPDRRNSCCMSDPSYNSTISWYADAW